MFDHFPNSLVKNMSQRCVFTHGELVLRFLKCTYPVCSLSNLYFRMHNMRVCDSKASSRKLMLALVWGLKYLTEE